jgi:hypothetical protein
MCSEYQQLIIEKNEVLGLWAPSLVPATQEAEVGASFEHRSLELSEQHSKTPVSKQERRERKK